MPRASTFIFSVFWLIALTSLSPATTYAQDYGQDGDKTNQKSREDDYRPTPYTEYGEFNESEREAESLTFFQYGRFFGVSLGVGFQGVMGNRGLLWQGGFPTLSLKLHYWFTLNIALQLEFYTAPHFFDDNNNNTQDVNMSHVGAAVKYYFETKDLSAALTFAGPFILLGAGNYSKTESSVATETFVTQSAVGFNAGGGLEFIISPRNSYFILEARIHFANFEDRFNREFESKGIPDLTGAFYTITGSLLFTW